MSLALFLLRLVLGGLLVGHGLRQGAGLLGGPGFDRLTADLRGSGFQEPTLAAMVISGGELIAGSFLVVGLLTPIAAAIGLTVVTLVAVVSHVNNGLWAADGGVEYPLVLGAVLVALAFTGPGAVSVDAAAGIELQGWDWGLTALLGGPVAAGAMLTLRNDPLSRQRRQPAERAAS